MIKVGDTVIQKVERSDNGVTTEIPVVATYGGNAYTESLIHLGYNSYYTVFTANTLSGSSLKSGAYATLTRKSKVANDYNRIYSRFIKVWMYLDKVPEPVDVGDGIEKSITIRFSFSSGTGYEYDTGNYVGDLYLKSTIKFYTKLDGGINKVYCQRSCVWIRGSTEIKSYIESEPQIVGTSYRGVMIALGINGNGLIPSGYCAFIQTYGDSTEKITYGDSETYGTLPLRPTNSNPVVSISVPNNNKILYRVEAASYKPDDSTSYDSNYCLHIINDEKAQGVSNDGYLTWSPYITWTDGEPEKPSGGKGYITPGTTVEMY